MLSDTFPKPDVRDVDSLDAALLSAIERVRRGQGTIRLASANRVESRDPDAREAASGGTAPQRPTKARCAAAERSSTRGARRGRVGEPPLGEDARRNTY